MLETAEKYLKYARQNLQDVRILGMVVFVIAVLLVSWSSIKTIDSNYQLQKQITALSQQNELQSLQNKNLQLENEYYQTDQYLELSARQNFGLAKPGETELLVPKDVALKHTVADSAGSAGKRAAETQPSWQHNLEAWVDFFLHRQPAD